MFIVSIFSIFPLIKHSSASVAAASGLFLVEGVLINMHPSHPFPAVDRQMSSCWKVVVHGPTIFYANRTSVRKTTMQNKKVGGFYRENKHFHVIK